VNNRHSAFIGREDEIICVTYMIFSCLQEFNDVINAMNKAQYPSEADGGKAGRQGTFDNFFANVAPKHLANFEKLASEGKWTSTTTAGELAILDIISKMSDVKPTEEILAPFPQLAAFWAANKDFVDDALSGLGPYFTVRADVW